MSGRATLYSFVINHRVPEAWGVAPRSVALVRLQEGPMMVSTVVDVPQTPERLKIDMPLEVRFFQVSNDIFLPVFGPPAGTERT